MQYAYQMELWVEGGFYMAVCLAIAELVGRALTYGVILLVVGFLGRRFLPWKRLWNLVLVLGVSFILFVLVVSGKFTWGHDSAQRITDMQNEIENVGILQNPPQSAVFWSSPISSGGHRYIALNPLGCSGNPTPVFDRTVSNLDAIFPVHASSLTGDNSVVVNKHFILGIPPFRGISDLPLGLQNAVVVQRLGANSFTLKTEPGHFLQGTAAHGIISDSSGRLWLYQIGAGVLNEKPYKQLFNYVMADKMWARMAKNIFLQYGAGCT